MTSACRVEAGISIILLHENALSVNPAIKTGESLDIWGGYHDAGDYDRLIGHVRIPSVLLTLFVVPAVYTLVAGEHRSPHYLRDLVSRLRATAPEVKDEASHVGQASPRA